MGKGGRARRQQREAEQTSARAALHGLLRVGLGGGGSVLVSIAIMNS